jgi:hypothetical protein
MGQSQRTFEKVVDNSEALRLRNQFQGKCGKHEGEYYFVTSIGSFYTSPERTLLIIALTPKPEGPNGVVERDLRELLEGANELPTGTTVAEINRRIQEFLNPQQ